MLFFFKVFQNIFSEGKLKDESPLDDDVGLTDFVSKITPRTVPQFVTGAVEIPVPPRRGK